MEAFSLLKLWRGSGGASSNAAAAAAPSTNVHTITTSKTIATSVLNPSAETDDDDGGDGDEGPFFDLEFAVPDEDGELEDGGENIESGVESDEDEEDGEFNFAVATEGSCGRGAGLTSDPSLPLSPSDDLFFKGRLVPIEPSSLVFTSSESNSKPQLPVALLKSATKLRVFMLGLKKPKSTGAESNTASSASPKQQQQQSKFFIKFKVEEVPIVSLFTRDNSSRSSGSSGRAAKQPAEEGVEAAETEAEEKKFSKDVVQKYLNKIKPLYVRVSKRYSEKLRFSGQLSSGGVVVEKVGSSEGGEAEAGDAEASAAAEEAATGGGKSQKAMGVNIPAGLRVVCKRLGKSRSASSAVAAVPSPPAVHAQRRDDSLLQLQDGIQSAIAHCKRSFNAAKGSESPMVRSKSDTYDGRSEKGKSDCV